MCNLILNNMKSEIAKYGQRLFFFLLLTCSIQVVRAQDVTYSFKRNEPQRVKLLIQAKIFDLDCSVADPFRVGVGLQADYFMPKALSLHAAYNKALFGIVNFNASTLNANKAELSKYNNYEAGLRLYLRDKMSTKKLRIVVSSEYVGYNTIRESSVEMNFPCRKIFAFRGGLYGGVTPVNSSWNKSNSPFDSKPGVQTTDGKTFGDYYYTNMQSFGFYGGLSLIAIINADYDMSGARSGSYIKRFFRETYLDLLYEPSQKFDPIFTDGQMHPLEANTAGSFKTTKLGFRLGTSVLKPKNGGMAFGLELGSRPGVSGVGLYFASRVAIVFGNRTRDKRK